jgi:hypothetical protein
MHPAGAHGRVVVHLLLRLELVALKPLQTQIAPRRIHRTNQSDLLNTQPTLNRPFALDRIPHIFEPLKINQPVEFVFRRKCRSNPLLCSRTLCSKLFVTPV